MLLFTNLKSFLKSEVRECRYKYRMSITKSNKVLLDSKFYKSFSTVTVERIKKVHDSVCKELMIKPLEASNWDKMERKILKQVSSLNPKEKISFVIFYELDDNYELTIEVNTTIK